MPFETTPFPRIAVIGGGVSGLGAAYELSKGAAVTLYEAAPTLGGHARTVIAGRNNDIPVDTGFIVFNYPNYPNLTRLFAELDVPVKLSDMSFSASIGDGWMEYGLKSINSIVGTRRNLARPQFWRMISDILRFNKHALALANDPSVTLGEFLDRMSLGDWFRRYYLLPLSGAIWSSTPDQMESFPARSLVQFFENHALLTRNNHQWYTVDGGSVEYVRRVENAVLSRGGDIRLQAPVQGVRRTTDGNFVRAEGGQWERFDHIVFACHSDDALRLLESPTAAEDHVLSRIRYQSNHAILHRDVRQMPRRKRVWASWVFQSLDDKPRPAIGITYWMNLLQGIDQRDQLFVSLNPARDIPDELVYDQAEFRHPIFDVAAIQAQRDLAALQGQNGTWFCGAYTRHGFHEDGLASGFSVASKIAEIETSSMTPEIVVGQTYHQRLDGPNNAFRYGVDYYMIEPEAEVRFPALCSRNRFNLTSINDRDHGGKRGDGQGAAWVRRVLRERGHDQLASMRVMLLAQPRALGHWFNPVSFWLILDGADGLRAVIAEVNNTFGHRHCYLCHHDDLRPIQADETLTADKIFYVSPFQPIAGTYAFRFDVSSGRIAVRIEYRHEAEGGGGLIATLTGRRRPLTSAQILLSMARRPFGSLRVLALIYAQALKLKVKRARFRSPPTPPVIEVS